MEKQEFLSLAESYYEELSSLPEAPTFYEYEQSLAALFHRLAGACMEKQLNASSPTTNRRKKKRLPDSGKSQY